MEIVSRALNNLSSEYYKNPRVAQLVLVFLVVYIVFNVYQYKKNDKVAVDEAAKVGEFSHGSSYVNISAMKHDMFKQMTIDLLPTLLIFGLPSVLYYFANRDSMDFIPIIRFDEIITFETYKDFMNSMLGRSILTVMGYFIFYQYVQPQFVNRIPFF